MAMRRWEPLGGLSRLHEEVDRMFQDFVRPILPMRLAELTTDGYRLPAIDLAEIDNEFVLKAELPGVAKKDLDIEVTPESVVLKAETSEEKETKEASYRRRERIYSCFQRVIDLPAEVKANAAKASFKDGLLEIHLPKSEAAKASKPVKVKVD